MPCRIIAQLEEREIKKRFNGSFGTTSSTHCYGKRVAARDRIVSCGESISLIIHSTYLDEVVNKTRQAFGILQRIGVNVFAQDSKRASKVMNISLTVHGSEGNQSVRVLYSAASHEDVMSKVEGEENKCPIPVNSSTPSSSGVKRKAGDAGSL